MIKKITQYLAHVKRPGKPLRKPGSLSGKLKSLCAKPGRLPGNGGTFPLNEVAVS